MAANLDPLLAGVKALAVAGVVQPPGASAAIVLNASTGVGLTYNQTTGQWDMTAEGGGGSSGQNPNMLGNGLNSNVATNNLPTLRLSGPSGAFSVGGFLLPAGATPSPGATLIIINTTAQPMTVVNDDAGSTDIYRISVQSGVSVTLPPYATASFLYDGGLSRWKLQSSGLHRPAIVNVDDYGAKGDGSTDDTGFIQAAVTYAGTVAARVTFRQGATYRVTTTINVTGTCDIDGNKATIKPQIPDAGGASVQVFYVKASLVTIERLYFDYNGLQTGNEGNRYCIFAAGASDGAHITDLIVRNCRMTNIKTGNFPTAIVGCHAIWVQWCDRVLIEKNFIQRVSGFGIFTEKNNYVTIKNNILDNTGWGSINSNSGDNWYLCDGNTITGTDAGNRDEGGSIALDGTPSDGYGPTTNAVIRNNYVTGCVAYGNGVRIGSAQNVEITGNIFDQIFSTPSAVGGVYQTAVSVECRNPQTVTWKNVRIHHNVFIAATSSLITGTAGQVGVTVENTDWSGIGTPGRAGPVLISDNQFLSASQTQAWTQAVLVHGQTGGIDGVDVHDNQGGGWCLSTANIPGMCAIDGLAASALTDAHVHHNRWVMVGSGNGNQIGNFVGSYVAGASLHDNVIGSWSIPYLQQGTGATSIENVDNAFAPVPLPLGHGGTIALPSGNTNNQFVVLTDTGLTSGSTVKFLVSSTPQEFVVNTLGVTFGIYTITLEVGANTKTLTIVSGGIIRVLSDGVGSLYQAAYT